MTRLGKETRAGAKEHEARRGQVVRPIVLSPRRPQDNQASRGLAKTRGGEEDAEEAEPHREARMASRAPSPGRPPELSPRLLFPRPRPRSGGRWTAGAPGATFVATP